MTFMNDIASQWQQDLTPTRSTEAIKDLLQRTDEYPKHVGTMQESNGFKYSRDELIALLQECSVNTVVGVHDINHYDPTGDGTSMRITVYATFARSELT